MASTVRAPRGRSSGGAKTAFVLAPLHRRAGGALIDLVLLVTVSGLTASLLESLTEGVTRVRIEAETGRRTVDAAIALPAWMPLALLVVLTGVYTVTLMATRGRTLGGWLVGIRCVSAESGACPGWAMSLRRWFVLYGAAGLLAFLPVVGPLAWIVTLVVGMSPLWDSRHRLRGYADYAGGDVVVLAPRWTGRSLRDPGARSPSLLRG